MKCKLRFDINFLGKNNFTNLLIKISEQKIKKTTFRQNSLDIDCKDPLTSKSSFKSNFNFN